MKQVILKTLLIVVLLTNNCIVNACTIFIANDGEHIWIGNNEDEEPNMKYRIWYYPAKKEDYGYTIWTELVKSKLLYGLMYLNPQGGINEYGLFMDYTAIDEVPVVQDVHKKDRKKQIVTDLLKKCKTVSEALEYISKYNLIKLKSAQLFIGDASGDYATVNGGYIIRKTDPCFTLTNYCINNGHKEACWRRDFSSEYVTQAKTFQLDDIKNILFKTAQKRPSNTVTNFSMAVDLKNKTIHLYSKNDFTTEAIINLADELKNGKHHKELVDYFPISLIDVLTEKYASSGIDATIDTYKKLRKNSGDKYNFKNNDAVNIAIQYIVSGKLKDAIKFLECLKEFDPNKTDIYTWLGVAYRRENKTDESATNFNKALTLNPNDYVATLFGRQDNQKVIFKMNDFEAAEKVSLVADFTDWKKNPIKMKKQNNVWFCEVSIPKGEYNYKFLVNKEYLADQINLMFTGTGPKIYSKLYVW